MQGSERGPWSRGCTLREKSSHRRHSFPLGLCVCPFSAPMVMGELPAHLLPHLSPDLRGRAFLPTAKGSVGGGRWPKPGHRDSVLGLLLELLGKGSFLSYASFPLPPLVAAERFGCKPGPSGGKFKPPKGRVSGRERYMEIHWLLMLFD